MCRTNKCRRSILLKAREIFQDRTKGDVWINGVQHNQQTRKRQQSNRWEIDQLQDTSHTDSGQSNDKNPVVTVGAAGQRLDQQIGRRSSRSAIGSAYHGLDLQICGRICRSAVGSADQWSDLQIGGQSSRSAVRAAVGSVDRRSEQHIGDRSSISVIRAADWRSEQQQISDRISRSWIGSADLRADLQISGRICRSGSGRICRLAVRAVDRRSEQRSDQ